MKKGTLPTGIKYEIKGDTTIIHGKCVFNGEPYHCKIPSEGFYKWMGGELVQRALPNISEDEREFLISGISPKGRNALFKK